jgi:hypothetical protein
VARNADRQPARLKWGVAVSVSTLDRVTDLFEPLGMNVSRVVELLIEAMADGHDCPLRRFVADHARDDDEASYRPFKAWTFSILPTSIERATALAAEFHVTRQMLVTLMLECLLVSDGDGDGSGGDGSGGGRRGLARLARVLGLIIYSKVNFAPDLAEARQG